MACKQLYGFCGIGGICILGFAAKIKQLNNLATLEIISVFCDSEYQDMSFSNFLIIDYLFDRRDEEITQKDIERQMVITRSTTSKMLKLMEEKGFVVRSNSAYDSRKKIITLLPKGIEYRKANLDKLDQLEKKFDKILSEEERNAFDTVYKKIMKQHER